MSEGLTELYTTVLNDHIQPEARYWDDFITTNTDYMMAFDILGILAPLSQPAETPNQIQGRLFDLLKTKAAVVLRMFQNALGNNVFTKGVQSYLKTMMFKTVKPQDLFDALQQAFDEVNPGNSINVGELMQTWLDLRSLPVVYVTRSDHQTLNILQSPFSPREEGTFNIPMTFTTASHPDHDDATAEFWMMAEEMDISFDESEKLRNNGNNWIMFNTQNAGYFITNYDADLWQLNAAALTADHDKIHPFNRGALFRDFFQMLIKEFDLNSSVFLEMTQSLALETTTHVWKRASRGLNEYDLRLRGTELHEKFSELIQHVSTLAYDLEIDDHVGRNIVNRFSCAFGNEKCLSEARQVLTEVMRTGSTSYEFDYRCNGFISASEIVWMHFFNKHLKEENLVTRYDGLQDFACTRNTALLRYFLDQAFDRRNNLRNFERDRIVEVVLESHYGGYDTVINYFRDYPDKMNS
jgi:hypothetical protein